MQSVCAGSNLVVSSLSHTHTTQHTHTHTHTHTQRLVCSQASFERMFTSVFLKNGRDAEASWAKEKENSDSENVPLSHLCVKPKVFFSRPPSNKFETLCLVSKRILCGKISLPYFTFFWRRDLLYASARDSNSLLVWLCLFGCLVVPEPELRNQTIGTKPT